MGKIQSSATVSGWQNSAMTQEASDGTKGGRLFVLPFLQKWVNFKILAYWTLDVVLETSMDIWKKQE